MRGPLHPQSSAKGAQHTLDRDNRLSPRTKVFDHKDSHQVSPRETGRAAKQGCSPLFPTDSAEIPLRLITCVQIRTKSVDKLGSEAGL